MCLVFILSENKFTSVQTFRMTHFIVENPVPVLYTYFYLFE